MDTSAKLANIAAEIADRLHGGIPALELALRDIEKRKSELQVKLDAAHLAHERAANFVVKIGPDYQCPRCWVRDKNRSALSPVPSNTKDNLFTCDTCGIDVRVEWVP